MTSSWSQPSASELPARYAEARAATVRLIDGLSAEDCQAQSMPDASPVKWHLAHTTWFFETFLLERLEPGFRPHDPAYRVLFNSYYNAVGDRHPRPQRGLLTRPTLAEVIAYRRAIDARMARLLGGALAENDQSLLELGLQHEQQHQELIVTDVLHLLSCNPLLPAYRTGPAAAARGPRPLQWIDQPGGLVEIGHAGDGFAFDNETPRHRVHLEPYALAERLVTQGEWASFIGDGGYRDPRWWLSAGWDWVQAQRIEAPLYWRRSDEPAGWRVFTLHGLQPLAADEPVVHVSCYEADAYARWAAAQGGLTDGVRLPTEAEWEAAATRDPARLQQLADTAWQWTASPYVAYPGYRPWAGAVGEYNGKFMINQMVLRGGSCATPPSHRRTSYRNFFPADARWQFSGVRLARDAR